MIDVYLYDGTFQSLLLLVYDLINKDISVSDIKSEYSYDVNLFSNYIKVEIKDRYKKIQIMKNNVSKITFRYLYYVYLSCNKDKEMIIYNFLKYYFIYKEKAYYHRNIDCVNNLYKVSHRVSNEAHKLKGFLRFSEMNDFLYAEYSSDNDVLSILCNHFKERLKTFCWIIKDKSRNKYGIYDTHKVIYLDEDDIIKLNLKLNDNELLIEDLWKTFFKTIAIKERENLKCQQNFMPKKYWNDMLEMEDRL